MNDQLYKVEEIIELTGENASYYMSQAMQGTIKIRGKFIRDAQGKLRPVLVKTGYQQNPPAQVLASETPSWGVAPMEFPIRRKKPKGVALWINWFRNLFK